MSSPDRIAAPSGRSLVLRGGRVLAPTTRPGQSVDRRADVVVVDGRVVAIEPGAVAPAGVREVDVRELLVVPGLIDLHVHLREPGHEYKEDIASGSRAAAAGGFATVCCMPNTSPVNDSRAVTELIVQRARQVNGVRVLPIGAITRGLEGRELAEIGEMTAAGVVALSDDGHPVMDAQVMRRGLEYAKTFGLTTIQHCEDRDLAAGGCMHEGAVATRLGLRGQPGMAESVMVARDLELVEWTGARYHVAHISTARSVALVRDAKRRGLPVTCEVTPHHLLLTDAACCGYDTSAKCAPPLRTQADLEALREALADGTIDVVATDHAPHGPVDKELEFDRAAFGMIGLETAVPLILSLVEQGCLSLERAIAAMTCAAAPVAGGLPGGAGLLRVGGVADITVIDPTLTWTVGPSTLRSKSHNTPWLGKPLRGRALLTVVEGRVVDGSVRHRGQDGFQSESPT